MKETSWWSWVAVIQLILSFGKVAKRDSFSVDFSKIIYMTKSFINNQFYFWFFELGRPGQSYSLFVCAPHLGFLTFVFGKGEPCLFIFQQLCLPSISLRVEEKQIKN